MVIQTYLPFPPYTSEGTQKKDRDRADDQRKFSRYKTKRGGDSPYNRKVYNGKDHTGIFLRDSGKRLASSYLMFEIRCLLTITAAAVYNP